MGVHIENLTIENFRALKKLSIEGLGRVNLYTGRNNTGKTSVLEALRLLATDGSPVTIVTILRSREEDVDLTSEPARLTDPESVFQLSSLFHGFPEFSVELPPVRIASTGGQRPMRLSMKAGLYEEERNPDGSRRIAHASQRDMFSEMEAIPAMVIETLDGERVLPLDNLWRNSRRSRLGRPDLPDESRLPCRFVSPYGGEQTQTLGFLWDRIALSEGEEHLIKALQIIDPGISAVSMVGGDSPRGTRTAIVRAEGLPRPVPLRSFGDGMNRLFGIVLSLVNAKHGFLLIDEFENGMHHTVQADAWRVIFSLAKRLDIQVMATTHSWDAIETFQKIASEDPEEGVLVRLSRKGEEIIPTVLREKELAIATRDRIEVR